MKYKIGDKVRIRSDLVADEFYGADMFVEEMIPYRGKEATIAKIIKDKGYRILEDGMEWFWYDEMIEGLAEPIKTNLDHYAKDILDYMYNSTCDKDVCNGCQICGICDTFVSKAGSKTEIRSKAFIEWLKEEYKEPRKPIQMTLFERSVLECAVNHGYEWIARDDRRNWLCIYKEKPRKGDGEWHSTDEECAIDLFDDKFQFIQWEDEEPYDIQWLLDNCEVKDDENS
jgi:hypothetical protein